MFKIVTCLAVGLVDHEVVNPGVVEDALDRDAGDGDRALCHSHVRDERPEQPVVRFGAPLAGRVCALVAPRPLENRGRAVPLGVAGESMDVHTGGPGRSANGGTARRREAVTSSCV